jgi:hypothetical protein
MKLLPLIFLGLAIGCGSHGAELATNDIAEARSEAGIALTAFKRRITPFNAVGLGFANTNEAQGSVLGTQEFLAYEIPRDKLAAYTGVQPFKDLVDPVERVIFPVMVHDRPKSTIVMSKVGKFWKTERTGGPRHIYELTETLKVISATNSAIADRTFAVEIPLLSVWLLGYRTDNNAVQLMTTATVKAGPITKSAHQMVDAPLMSAFSKIAQNYGGASN